MNLYRPKNFITTVNLLYHLLFFGHASDIISLISDD